MTPDVVGVGATVDEGPGYRVTTRSGGQKYVTTLRREKNSDDRVYRPTERFTIDPDTGEREDLDAKATKAVEKAIEERGGVVA
jgi:hypothetical protein